MSYFTFQYSNNITNHHLQVSMANYQNYPYKVNSFYQSLKHILHVILLIKYKVQIFFQVFLYHLKYKTAFLLNLFLPIILKIFVTSEVSYDDGVYPKANAPSDTYELYPIILVTAINFSWFKIIISSWFSNSNSKLISFSNNYIIFYLS